jgi:hypothetical protein
MTKLEELEFVAEKGLVGELWRKRRNKLLEEKDFTDLDEKESSGNPFDWRLGEGIGGDEL